MAAAPTCSRRHWRPGCGHQNGHSTRNWGLGSGPGPWEDLQRFLTDAGSLAEELLAEGLAGMKIWPFDGFAEVSYGTRLGAAELDKALDPVRRIRAAVGDRLDIMIELHGLWNVPTARKIVCALEPFRPFWIGDPLRSDLVDGLAEVAQAAAAAGTMIVAGETVAQVAGFVPLLTSAAVDVVTVDPAWCGGLTQAVKIAAVAETYGRAIAPHDCTGRVALVAATHLSVSAPNALLQETVRASLRTWYRDFVTDLPTIEEGWIRPPAGPGLGTRLQPDLAGAGRCVRQGLALSWQQAGGSGE